MGLFASRIKDLIELVPEGRNLSIRLISGCIMRDSAADPYLQTLTKAGIFIIFYRVIKNK